jgi:hypothetical protein
MALLEEISMSQPSAAPPRKMRCFTRAVKNARYLQEHAPDTFAKRLTGPGMGTGLPVEILHHLHKMKHDSPELKPFPAVAEFLRKHPMPALRRWPSRAGKQ